MGLYFILKSIEKFPWDITYGCIYTLYPISLAVVLSQYALEIHLCRGMQLPFFFTAV